MVLNLTGFSFDVGKSKYITVNTYGAHWLKDIKDNVICLNKQQSKDAVTYLVFNCYFAVGTKVVCQIIVISMRSDKNLFLRTYSYFL